MNIVKVSPKGQITIPKKVRELCDSSQYLFEMQRKNIILRPVVITPLDELEGFAALAEKSFDFWADDRDDVYEDFYKDKE